LTRLPIILLVDDDEDHLFVAERAIGRAGIRAKLCMAHDGKEALRVLDQETAPGADGLVALVMLDLRMPGMNGLEMLRRVRVDERTRGVPVVVISSSDRPDEVRESYALGANSYVVKRYDDGSPGAYLAEIARYWVELNEWPEPSTSAARGPDAD
jgi:two-component system response regulator